MSITADEIKQLRELTGAGISDVKKALDESGGDKDKAFRLLERKLGASAIKKAGRETKSGLVDAYIHSNGKIGALVEVFCETDFVARNPQFRELAHGLAMHIAASAPVYLSLETVPLEVWQAEKNNFEEEIKKMTKPREILAEIVDGKLKAHFGALSLLSQPFVKDQDKTVDEIVKEAIGRFGENIKIGQFARFEI